MKFPNNDDGLDRRRNRAEPEPHNGKQVAPEWAHFGTAPGEPIRVRNPKNRRKVLGRLADLADGLDINPFTGR
jgi:hypothetical protein